MTGPALEVVKLTKEYTIQFGKKKVRAIDNLSFQVAMGETYGLIGVNGAGKTTTIKLILGLLKPTLGTISILGYKGKKALKLTGFLPENPCFYPYLSALEFLDFTGQIFSLNKKERQTRKEALLDMVSLTSYAHLPIAKYSKGMIQRLGIAQSLIHDPNLLILDEPTSGLDPIARRDVLAILNALKKQGKTIFLNSHILTDMQTICDRVGILHNGKLVGENNISENVDLEEYFFDCVDKANSELVNL